jgi:hypothetical protein
MGLLSGLMGHASEISIEKLQEEFSPILIDGEVLEKAFRKDNNINEAYRLLSKYIL